MADVTREDRIRALSTLASVVEEVWGERCSMKEPACGCCFAWTVFDLMAELTDTEMLDVVSADRAFNSQR